MASQGAKSTSSVKPVTTAAYEHGASGTSSAAKTKGGRTVQAKRRSAPVALTSTVEDDVYGFLEGVGKNTFGSGSRFVPAHTNESGARITPPGIEGGDEGGGENPLKRRVQWNGSQLRAPRSSPTLSGPPSTGARFNKGTSARLIVLAMGVAGVSIIFAGRNFKPYTSTVNGKTVKVPGTLHAFAGLTIAGTIALIVNEISAELGVVFAVGLGFLALTDAQAFATWGTKVFGGKGVQGSGTSGGGPSTGGATNLPVSPHALPQGGMWEPPGGVGSNAPGAAGPGQGPVELPPGAPSG